MSTQIFPNRFSSRTACLAAASVFAVIFCARVIAQTPAIPDAPTVPTAPSLPDAAVINEPLPSAASQEVIEQQPSQQHVWIAGHWRWQDGRYAWIAGRWDLPPRANVTWVEPRWERRSSGYALAGGYWQEVAGSANAAVVASAPAPAPVVVNTPTPAPVVATTSAPPTVYVVEQAPPPPMREYIIERPSPRHVWISGYWGWRAGRHVWMGGHWDLPPRERVEWVEPRWERRSNGYVLVEGLWRDIGGSGVSVGVAIGSPGPSREAIIIRSAPPPPRREFVDERYRPSPRHVWVSGYWRHDGRVFVWMPGRWDLPPREYRTWEPHRWESRGGTYIFVEGRWH